MMRVAQSRVAGPDGEWADDVDEAGFVSGNRSGAQPGAGWRVTPGRAGVSRSAGADADRAPGQAAPAGFEGDAEGDFRPVDVGVVLGTVVFVVVVGVLGLWILRALSASPAVSGYGHGPVKQFGSW
jgi:hypothetical protein